MADVVVVGAGIVGLAVAHELLERRPGSEVVVLEKEDRVAAHQSSHNSGVVHAGIYYRPGSAKARLTVAGRQRLMDFAEANGIPVAPVGKVVVATERSELAPLEELHRRAIDNGVPGVELIDPQRLREVEPHARGVRALWSPATAVTDFARIAAALAEQVTARGGSVLTGHTVRAIDRSGDTVRVTAGERELEAAAVVTCAGLQSDRVAALTGHEEDRRVVPFRGEYLELRPPANDLVRGNIYPVPDPRYPFLGVHFTRRLDGRVLVGPNALLGLAREAYAGDRFDVDDVRATFGFGGFWRFAARNVPAGAIELWHAVVRRAYLKRIQAYLPAVTAGDLTDGPTGIRAQVIDRGGRLIDDFSFGGSDRVLHVRNAPSPAATASFAIASVIVDELGRRGALATVGGDRGSR